MPVLEDAKATVGAYSPTIASTGKIRVTGGGIVKVIFGQKGYQTHNNAAAIENQGKGFVRHPVFVKRADLPGPAGRWTEKNSHPAFLAPAFERHKDEIIAATTAAILKACEETLER